MLFPVSALKLLSVLGWSVTALCWEEHHLLRSLRAQVGNQQSGFMEAPWDLGSHKLQGRAAWRRRRRFPGGQGCRGHEACTQGRRGQPFRVGAQVGKAGQTAEGGRTAEKEVPVQKSQRAMRNILTGGLMSVPGGNSKSPCAAEG